MKTKNKTIIFAAVLFGLSLLLLGCNMINAPEPFVTEPGKGLVTVSFQAGKAALSPDRMDFDNYQFTFYRNGAFVSSAVKGKNEQFAFSLETGSGYTLEVKAYKGAVADETLAALGETDPFTVNTITPLTVYLNGFLSDGLKGFFSYHILYPGDAEIVELILRLNKDDERDLLSLLSAPFNGEVSDLVELTAGKYFVILRLNRDDGKEFAGYANGVEIMSGQTTYYGTELTPILFTIDDFVSIPNLSSVRVSNWRGFDVEGMSHYYNNDRETNGRAGIPWGPENFNTSLDGNYDPSRAVGYKYTTFTDAAGKTWNDVLKLVPPVYNNPLYFREYGEYNGYQPYTITLSYPLKEAGEYKLSMWYQVEDGTDPVTVFWQNTGGIHGEGGGSWKNIPNEPAIPIPVLQGTPLYLEGIFEVRDNEEIGMLARQSGGQGGLKDATIYILDLKVEKAVPTVIEVETITSWEEFDLAFDISGTKDGDDNPGGVYFGGKSNYDFVNYQGYENVLRLEPRANLKGVGISMMYEIPYSGKYTFTMDAWIDPSSLEMPFIWFRCDDWAGIINSHKVTPLHIPEYGKWVTYSGEMDLTAGNMTGFYVHWVDGSMSYNDTFVYFRNFKLEFENGGDNYVICDIVCSPAPEVGITTVTTWEEIQDGWAGWHRDLGHDKFYHSNAEVSKLGSWQAPGDVNVYSNVLKVAPPADGSYSIGPDGGSLAVNYEVPVTGHYTFSADVWIDTTTCLPDFHDRFRLTWWNASLALGWNTLATLEKGVIPAGWYTLTSSIPLEMDAGSTLGLYARNGGNQEGLWDATVYIKNFKLELAGAENALIDIRSNSSAVSLQQWQTVTTWAAIDKAGSPGRPSNGDPDYKSSNARWSIDNDNILKLYPPEGEYAKWGAVAAAYTVPFDGVYKLSMDVRVEPNNGQRVDITWHEWSNWGLFFKELGVENSQGAGFLHLAGSSKTQGGQTAAINAGTVIGLLTSLYNGNDIEGVKDAVIYIKNFKLELQDGENTHVILDISSTAVDTVNQSITLQWDNTGLNLLPQTPITISKGDSVTLNAPAGVTNCQWYVEGWPVPLATGSSFKFDSNDFNDPGSYTVSLWAGSNGGDAIVITVAGE